MSGPRSQYPILAIGKDGTRVYVVTRYLFLPRGECVPVIKWDVTGQFEYVSELLKDRSPSR